MHGAARRQVGGSRDSRPRGRPDGVESQGHPAYERRQLLPEADRTKAGYRLFSEHDLAILQFIRRARTLDLHLDEINDILDLQLSGEQPCGRVTALLDAHLIEIDQKLTDLRRLRRALLAARSSARDARCGGRDAVICQIIEDAPPVLGRT